MSTLINERISLIINELGLNNNSFAKSLGVSPAVTFNIIAGRQTKPSFDLLHKILSTYDNLSAEWLLRGVGDIYIARNENKRLQITGPIKHLTRINRGSTEHNAEMISVLKAQLDEANKLNCSLAEIILNLSMHSQAI